MERLAMLFGALMIAVSLVAFLSPGTLGDFDPAKSRGTALAGAGIGAVILLCGLITLLKPTVRKHAMHVAASVGVLGIVGGFVPMMRSGFDFTKASAVAGMLTTGLCVLFVVLCVRSFVAARMARNTPAA